MKKGLFIIYTGKGKGKTTAALGTAFRALGHQHKVCIIQFIKGNWKYGELETAKAFEDLLELHVLGTGFTWKSENLEHDKAIAQKAWNFAKNTIKENKHELIILDELTYLIKYGMVSEEDIIEAINQRHHDQHVLVTGRYASESLIENANLVTEMTVVKHPYKTEGIKAQKGIEF